MKKLLLPIPIICIMISCVEEKNKFVTAHRIDGYDTLSVKVISVDKNFQAGDTFISKDDSVKYKIIRNYRRRY